ncbi:MAG TPA: N-formylglutamate amidohydrolase [Aliidongia sp.]|nr:N-formylglutamate amidohydrolase [Aliidongia sp.]
MIPPAFELINPDGAARTLLLCDHAANIVPAEMGSLGLTEAELSRHIGWDIGAAAVTGSLARQLDAPAVLSGYSRLVIDCNRALDDPTAFPTVSDRLPIPGNQELSGNDKAMRADSFYWPYHRAIEARLDRFAAAQVAPAIISIHSFTPTMNEFDRPWHIGILWDKDPRLPMPLLAGLATIDGLVIGDNQPYSARDPEGFTLRHHAVRRGLPHVLIELRQDEIADAAGAERYAAYLLKVLSPILADPELYRPAIYL